MDTINIQLIQLALDRSKGTEFEYFFHAFYPALAGIEFIPLGGYHDGGADAFQDLSLFENKKQGVETFYQATIQKGHRQKIRHTVRRLREFGRKPKALKYVTSRNIAQIDKEQEILSQELDVGIEIRDQQWIMVNVNHSPQTIEAFRTYLGPSVAFLSQLGAATTVGNSQNIATRTLCVFLGQEVERRRGNSDLLEAVTDSLILWSLENTDPDRSILMTRKGILEKIEGVLPSAKQFIHGVFDNRISILTSKSNPTGREIRWYKKQDKFCLPYETREIVKQENMEDEHLKLQVINLYNQRSATLLGDDESVEPEQVANIVHRSLELTFEQEGLKLSEFLSGKPKDYQSIAISDQVDEAIENAEVDSDLKTKTKQVVMEVLRQAFYSSTEEERIYYGKLSRTYTLMLTLQNEPKIVEYFKGMSSDFILFVGTDIIVRALSEKYLAEEDQMTINMLRVLYDAGADLILTELTVNEIHAHLKSTDNEFKNYFEMEEQYITKEIASHCGKILLRAYFYAKFDNSLNTQPKSWGLFIEQICNYNNLRNDALSRDEIKNYLIEKFKFKYVDSDDLKEITNEEEVEQLANIISNIKSEEVLALNDARHILSVYGKRRTLGEMHKPNPYGFRTWWLTHEANVLKVTKNLVQQHGSPYIIRPEFILNFIAFSPTMEEVRQSYNNIFPTLLGVKMSNRMREDIYHDVLNRIRETYGMDDARVKSKLIELSNQLKGDGYKYYESNLAQTQGL